MPWLDELSWPLEAALLLVGFALLARGADWLVDGGVSLARRWGVRPLLVGLTVVAWGTSLPEVVVSSLAAVEGRPGASLGNVLGSNVANIGLVLGTSALVLPAILRDRMRGQEAGWLLGALLALWGVCLDGHLTRVEAAGLLAVFLLYNLLLFRSGLRLSEEAGHELDEEHVMRRPWLGVLSGALAVAIGARLVVTGGTGLAARAGLPDTVIGLTIFALGTSLPELAAGLGSALKGHAEMSFGNVVGSNVFNCLAVIGITGLVTPFDGGDPALAAEMSSALARDFPLNLAFALALLGLPLLAGSSYLRPKALLLASAYLGYVVWLLLPSLGG